MHVVRTRENDTGEKRGERDRYRSGSGVIERDSVV
jgi:hypothetical protein